MNYLITWFYGEKKGDESFYPSVGGNTSSPEFHKVYWKCVYDFYKSALLTNGQKIKYMFFTNINNIPTDVDGINILKFFSKNDIEVINIELSKKTPIDWYGAWRNQLYEFDILEYLSHFSDEDSFLILDSDCIIRRELYDVFEAVKKNRAVCYECGYTSNHSINGISILQMQSLYDEFYGRGARTFLIMAENLSV